MHHAPAVSYPVGRSRFHAYLLAAGVVLGGASLAAWCAQAAVALAWQVGAWVLWLLTTAMAIGRWWRTPAGLLSWDAQGWTLTGPSQHPNPAPLTLRAVLDLQGTLLLLAQPLPVAAAPRPSRGWLWAERRRAPLRWLALRRAVFAPQQAAASAAADVDGLRQ